MHDILQEGMTLYMKKFASLMCALALIVSCFSLTAFAAENDSVPEVTATEAQDVGIQSLSTGEADVLPAQEFEDLDALVQTSEFSLSDIPSNALNARDAWAIRDPVFVGNGTLSDSFDIYVVTLTAKQISFLKLNSSNSNLMAVLYYVDNGSLAGSTGWGVHANDGEAFINIPAGQYAIVIGSATGNEVGNYKLMWNCSNPSGAQAIVDTTADLSRVVLYYDNSQVLANGNNILTKLTWEEHETWYTSLGYSARDMSMTMFEARGVYLGSFSSSAPYSAPNALLVDVQRGSWLYTNSYYTNNLGNVTHVINWYDPSGMETPRTFGEGPLDFSYGNNYIVINLDTFEVCEFLSPFNYHYTKDGGRTFSLTNLQRLG